ncbi:MAG: hypothetical protein J1E43_07740 [Christensenellaceae bacterium]|nr:hypothetical protein [Christensenellaceae bacterium]
MNCDKELVLVYLEEDNIARAYFRVRPLLTISGDAQEEAVRLWPDHGCLRIVPDRNEQHTFKERMRAIGPYCMMNLTNVPPEANKIRTNKNYHPDHGECNQYILYSDTVYPLPEHTFFQVLDGKADDFASLAPQAITPLFFIREDGALHGPVRKDTPEQPSAAEGTVEPLYSIACPDGQTRLILCRETPVEQIEAPVNPQADEPLPIGKPLQILDASRDFEETLKDIAQPLSQSANLLHEAPRQEAPQPRPAPTGGLTGTPLYRAPLRTSVPQPKNKLQEVVSSQWRIARNEPPADPLPAGAAMNNVVNPVETACNSLRAAWQLPESRAQLVDFLFSLDGMRAHLEPAAGAAGTTPLQKVLLSRLQDLEAERLTALVQLDKAKSDVDTFRRQTIARLSEKAKAESDALAKTAAGLEERIDALKLQLNTLTEQRDSLLRTVDELTHQALPEALAKALTDAAMTAPVHGIPLRMTSVAGTKTAANELLNRVQSASEACGVEMTRNACAALLLLLAVSPRVGLSAPSTAAASTWFKNVVHALGWQSGYAVQVSTEQVPLAATRPADGTPHLLVSTLPTYAPMSGVTRLFLSKTIPNSAAFEMDPWPIYPLSITAFVPAVEADGSPVSASSLIALLDAPALSDAEFHTALDPILAVAAPLSGSAMLEMRRLIAAAAPLMEGGLPAAIDWALQMWVLPSARGDARIARALKPLVQEYPLTFARL